ncbi:enoyl-CoA hydratase/isomerase family protein [Sporichthya sp.]|uniref:enoyl-CoA hydratase/isomerase family protein n=1 Tax=Sporichthya sp. TaxID=65475 RepID=UPI00185BC30F|nr:enoyl-CoA hydratase/isomerase family protein [Sporichthya sp.]MBA3741368.1 enoyl-CoA hydratase/isomerase family protein [Sporichthya sp.]
MSELYDRFSSLVVRGPVGGVLTVTLSGPKLNAVDAATHTELVDIWTVVDRDPDVSAVLLNGEGKGFSAGATFDFLESLVTDFAVRVRVMREGRDLVYNMLNCSKPIVSAIHGPAYGAAMVAGLLADVSVVARSAQLVDGHTRIGLAAGDHASLIWPLLCGMAKAKYHVLLCEPLNGEEAERLGLVSLCVDDADLVARSEQIAEQLAAGSKTAIRWTKLSMNNLYRALGPVFDASLGLEFVGLGGPDFMEGVAALREGRAPIFAGPASE